MRVADFSDRKEYPLPHDEHEKVLSENQLDIYERAVIYGERLDIIAAEFGVTNQAISQTVRRVARKLRRSYA